MKQLHAAQDQQPDDLLFVLEIHIQGGFAVSRLPGNVVHGDGGDAALGEKALCGVGNAGAVGAGGLFFSSGHGGSFLLNLIHTIN